MAFCCYFYVRKFQTKTKKGPESAPRKMGNAIIVPFILRQLETIYQMVTVHGIDPEQGPGRVRRFSSV